MASCWAFSPRGRPCDVDVKGSDDDNDPLVLVHCYSQGGKEYLMRAHFGLPSVTSEETEGKPPIQVKFEIPYFTTSGIQVSLKDIPTPSMRPRREP
jgi:hypothetical protein